MPEQQVLGRLVRLDDIRLVFVGRCDEDPSIIYIGFRNSESEDLKLRVSREAFEALRLLCEHHDLDGPWKRETFPTNPNQPKNFQWDYEATITGWTKLSEPSKDT